MGMTVVTSLLFVTSYTFKFSEVEVDCLVEAPSLETVNLKNNPLTPRTHEQLSQISKIHVTISPREKEDWEDLTI